MAGNVDDFSGMFNSGDDAANAFKNLDSDSQKALKNLIKNLKSTGAVFNETFGPKLQAQVIKLASLLQSRGVDSLEDFADSFHKVISEFEESKDAIDDTGKAVKKALSESFGASLAHHMSGELKKSNETLKGHSQAIKKNRTEIAQSIIAYSKGFSASTPAGVTRKLGVELPNMLSGILSKMLDSSKQKSAVDGIKQSQQAFLDSMKNLSSGIKIEANKINDIKKSLSGDGGKGKTPSIANTDPMASKGAGVKDKLNSAQKIVTGAMTSFFEIYAQAQELSVQIGKRLLDGHFAIQEAMENAGGDLNKDYSGDLKEGLKAQYAVIGEYGRLTQLESQKIHAQAITAGFKNLRSELGAGFNATLTEAASISSRFFPGGDLYKMMALASRITGQSMQALTKKIGDPLANLKKVLDKTNIPLNSFIKGIQETTEAATAFQVDQKDVIHMATNIAGQEAILAKMGIDVAKSLGGILTGITTGFNKMSDGMKAYVGMKAFGTNNPFEAMDRMEFGQPIEDVIEGKTVNQADLTQKRLGPILDMTREIMSMSGGDTSQAFRMAKMNPFFKEMGLDSNAIKVLFTEIKKPGTLFGDPAKSAEMMQKIEIGGMTKAEKENALVKSAQHADKVSDLQLKLQEAMLGIMTSTYLATAAGLAATVNWLSEIGSSKWISPTNYMLKKQMQNSGVMESDADLSRKRQAMGQIATDALGNILPQLSKTLEIQKEIQIYTKTQGVQVLNQMKAGAAVMANTVVGSKASGVSVDYLENAAKTLSKNRRHSGGQIPTFHSGGMPGLQGMTSGAILRNDEIFIGGNVGKAGQVLSPQESKNAVSTKAPVIQFNGPVYGINEFKRAIEQIVDQHLGTM